MQEGETHTKRFTRNIFLLLAVSLIIKPVYVFFIDAQVQNHLGENLYGLYFELFNFCVLFQIILDPGIMNYNTQLISKETTNAEKHFRDIASSRLILLLVYILLVSASALLIDYPKEYYTYLPGVMGILILGSFAQYFRSHFAALGKYHYEAWLSGLDKLLMIFIIGYFLYIRKDIELSTFINGQLISLVITGLLFLVILGGMIKMRIRLSVTKLVALIKKTYPFAFILLFMAIYTRIDGVMLGRLLDDDSYSAGLYARSFRLLDSANMIGIMFASLMLPMFSKLIDKRKELNELVEEVSRILFLVCLMVCLVCWYYHKEIMDLVYINNGEEHYRVFRYLMIGFFAMGMSNIFGCLFLASERLKKINILLGLGIVVNVSANYMLIPEFEAFGAVMATLFTQFFVFIGQLFLAVKEFKIKYSASSLIGGAIISLVSFFIFQIAATQISWKWWVELILLSFLLLILAFLSGFVRYNLVLKNKQQEST